MGMDVDVHVHVHIHAHALVACYMYASIALVHTGVFGPMIGFLRDAFDGYEATMTLATTMFNSSGR